MPTEPQPTRAAEHLSSHRGQILSARPLCLVLHRDPEAVAERARHLALAREQFRTLENIVSDEIGGALDDESPEDAIEWVRELQARGEDLIETLRHA